MIKQLTRLANHLDSKGLRREADYLDALIRKIADGDTPARMVQEDDRNPIKASGWKEYKLRVLKDEDYEYFKSAQQQDSGGPSGPYDWDNVEAIAIQLASEDPSSAYNKAVAVEKAWALAVEEGRAADYVKKDESDTFPGFTRWYHAANQTGELGSNARWLSKTDVLPLINSLGNNILKNVNTQSGTHSFISNPNPTSGNPTVN